MLSIFLPSKRLAELPGVAIGEASVMMFSQMATRRSGTQLYRKHRVAQHPLPDCSGELSRSARRCSWQRQTFRGPIW